MSPFHIPHTSRSRNNNGIHRQLDFNPGENTISPSPASKVPNRQTDFLVGLYVGASQLLDVIWVA